MHETVQTRAAQAEDVVPLAQLLDHQPGRFDRLKLRLLEPLAEPSGNFGLQVRFVDRVGGQRTLCSGGTP